MEDLRELLASIKLGEHTIDFYRDHETGGIQVCDGELCAALPTAGGQQAVELFDLLEKVGDKTVFPVDTVFPKVSKDGEEYPPSDEEELPDGE